MINLKKYIKGSLFKIENTENIKTRNINEPNIKTENNSTRNIKIGNTKTKNSKSKTLLWNMYHTYERTLL